ncbi:hypothetical protein BV25DRAFT_1270518 [Artomyces pyxidatus]|uniref:Uncharacterized protein n=1 Tax=Artomyces pyxidatus TaxID=48021 RepID=A0ACB8TF05_9AGAM|nr:hypothetical protein BV25DRAFT_1270518 [Artomyces pyxidatus]
MGISWWQDRASHEYLLSTLSRYEVVVGRCGALALLLASQSVLGRSRTLPGGSADASRTVRLGGNCTVPAQAAWTLDLRVYLSRYARHRMLAGHQPSVLQRAAFSTRNTPEGSSDSTDRSAPTGFAVVPQGRYPDVHDGGGNARTPSLTAIILVYAGPGK